MLIRCRNNNDQNCTMLLSKNPPLKIPLSLWSVSKAIQNSIHSFGRNSPQGFYSLVGCACSLQVTIDTLRMIRPEKTLKVQHMSIFHAKVLLHDLRTPVQALNCFNVILLNYFGIAADGIGVQPDNFSGEAINAAIDTNRSLREIIMPPKRSPFPQ